MPYMELRDYRQSDKTLTKQQVEQIMSVTRNHLARDKQIDGTFEFRYLPKSSELDYCEYEFVYVIDMGYSDERDANKAELAKLIGAELAPIIKSNNLSVRLRLQNAAFVPFGLKQ